MWPMRLELSRDECKKCLRCLELEAYGNMVSVLRAQGSFTSDKQNLLQELAKALHISNERHRAEIRRAVNDEKLSTIAEQLNGPNTGTDWAIEGRRTIPLLPRLNACTVFTSLANSLSLATSAANVKKASTSREEAANVKVKVETESVREKLGDNISPVNALSAEPEVQSINRKRRRSRVEFQDVSSSANELNDVSNIVKDVVTSFSCIGSGSSSLVPVSLSNKVFIVSTSSPSQTPRNNIVDNTVETNAVNSSCSTTSTSQITPSHPSGISCVELNSTVPCQAVVSQHTSYTHAPTQDSSRSLSTVVPTYVTATVSGEMQPAKVISTQTKLQPRTTSIVIPTCSSQHSIRKSLSPEASDTQMSNDGDRSMKLVQLTSCTQQTARSVSTTSCARVRRITTTTHSSTRPAVVAKPISSKSEPQTVTVGTGISSSGPGPPHTKPTAAVLCKEMASVKSGLQGRTKMGITLNSNKTVNIAASNPGSRMAAKANVIVVQKGPARGVTLSHAGKEVLGKVIMGGKKLCLSNQQSPGSIALLPHRISANGEQSSVMLSPINSAQTESVKPNTKQSSNMIVFDLRQDSLEKSKVLSEILEASGVFSSESKTAILNTKSHPLTKELDKDAQTPTCPTSTSPDMKSGATISFVMDSKEHRKNRETVANADSDRTESPAESKIDDLQTEILSSSDCVSEKRGTLDPQTGIYSFQVPENSMNNIQTDESISSSTGIDIFSTALASADINLGSFQYIDDNESNTALDDVRNQILTIDQLNDLYEGHQSISDKSNC